MREHDKIDATKERGKNHGAQTIHNTAQYKTKIVLEVLQGEKELGEIVAENGLNPNMVRNWKREFVENASKVFEDQRKAEMEVKKKEEAQRKEEARMLKAIGQLTLERDFLQDCFRQTGQAIPEFDSEKF